MEEMNLLNILEAFNAAINEEQAWAVCYQCCKYFESLRKTDPACCYALTGLESLILNKDGIVSKVITSEGVGPAVTEEALVESVGVVLFQALDYGLSEEEEHQLSPPLEALIDRMTGGGGSLSRKSTESSAAVEEEEGEGAGAEEPDDEGIEELADEEEEAQENSNRLSLQDVLTVCKIHLANSSHEASHYKAVVRALVTEALELMSFLEKISSHNQRLRSQPSADEEDSVVTDLKRADWARLWMQIMKNLRKGVKLKKVDNSVSNQSPSEFELTPYEVLMEDIRTRRYELRKVMVNGDIPTTVKKDAHEVILDFIRSRPPLHPMKDRQLPDAPPRTPDMREMLMNDIKQHHTLRPTPGNIMKRGSNSELAKQDEGTPQTTRKVIKPNICLFDSDEDEELSEDEDEEEEEEDKNKVTPSPLSPLTPLSPDASKTSKRKSMWRGDDDDDDDDDDTDSVYTTYSAEMRELFGDTTDSDMQNSERRHSITLMQTPSDPAAAPAPPATDATDNPEDLGITGGNIMGPHGPSGPLHGFMASYNAAGNQDVSDIPRSLQSSLECLSLTVEEVMHIRSVLTKAELECLVSRPELYTLVSKGKVCFTCKKTRFSLFGSWATKCKFCRRNVCSTCSSKMRIPTEHFENIPVYTLSPSPVSPSNSGTNLFFFESNGSEPSSPTAPRKSFMPFLNAAAASFTPASLTSLTSSSSSSQRRRGSLEETNKARAPLQRTQTTVRPPPLKPEASVQGLPMTVCKDCKAMIVNIIRASRMCMAVTPGGSGRGRGVAPGEDEGSEESRGSAKPARNFHLNLKPVHQFGNGKAGNSSKDKQ